jgi:hypothetical protein
MDLLTKILLALVYILMLPVRFVRTLLGRDTLQLRRPANTSSYWIVREADPNGPSYFSETSLAEGKPALREGGNRRNDRGAARWFTPMLRTIARLHAPPRELKADKYAAGADREQDIPDEVYTLW